MADDALLKDILYKALGMEEKGHKFYEDNGRKSQNDIVRRTFDFLAKNELFHIKSIKDFYEALEEKGEFPSVSFDKVKGPRMDDLTIFANSISSLEEKIKPVEDDKKALEFAMDFENSGYRYYENALKGAKDERLVKLLKFLLAEESRHYDLLQSAHAYVTDSGNWLMYEEDSFPQGG